MMLTEPGKNYLSRVLKYRDNLLSIIEYDGFPHKFPSDYNWLIRQRGLYKNGELNKEYKCILDAYLPGWNADTYTMLTNARRQRLVELATHGYPEIGEMINNLPADDAYILAKLGMDSIGRIVFIPANFMYSGAYKSMANYIYQRSVAKDYTVAKVVQNSIFNLAKKKYPNITKELLAAYWLKSKSLFTKNYIGNNTYLFNFAAINMGTAYGATGIDHDHEMLNDRELRVFASKYRNTLIKLCDCFMNEAEFKNIIKTAEFRSLYKEISDVPAEELAHKTTHTPYTVDEKRQKQIIREKKPVKTTGIIGLMNMFKRDKQSEYDIASDITNKKLKPKGPDRGDGVGLTAGDEYNTGYVGSTSSGNSGGHSFGEFLAAAAILDAADGDLDGDFGGDSDGDSDD